MKTIKITLRFEPATGNGQSCCIVCKRISWDSMMYKCIDLGDKRFCGECYRGFMSRGEVIE